MARAGVVVHLGGFGKSHALPVEVLRALRIRQAGSRSGTWVRGLLLLIGICIPLCCRSHVVWAICHRSLC
jgi:hypothetical protein